MLPNIILTILLGSFAGLCAGSLGQSGAEVMIPGLILLNIITDYKTAIGTVLLTIMPPISLLAVLQYYKKGQVNVVVAAILFCSFFFVALIGAYITQNLSDTTIEYITGFYFLMISMFFFWRSYTGTYVKIKDGHKQVSPLINGFKNLYRL